jgi:hypothetical protein
VIFLPTRPKRKYNIKKDLDYGFDEIIVAAVDKATKERIVTESKESGLDLEKEGRVEIVEITGFLNSGHV